MRKKTLVLLVASLASVMLASACVAPAPPPDSDIPRLTVFSSEKPELALRHQINITEPGATIRVSATATVFGPVRFCASVVDLDLYSNTPGSSSCRTINMTPGTPQSFNLPAASPTGDYPFDGVVGVSSSITPSVPSGTLVFGAIVSSTGSELGCLGLWLYGDGPWECYV